jgi:membrane-bound lytic murein transglycosylase D
LAITGYNYGPSGIARLSRKLKTKDLVEIIELEKSNRFGFASGNFYASFLAALQVEAEADKYFDDPKWMPEMRAKEYKLSKSIRYNSLQQVFKDAGYDLDLYNPQFTRRTKKYNGLIYSGYRIYVPSKKADEMWASIVKLKANRLAKRGDGGDTYRVRRGDTLSHIAERFGVRVSDIIEWNDLASSRIYAGQTLKIPN